MKEILEVIAKLGVGGGIGALIGIGIVTWVEPETKGGMAILILIPVIFCMTMTSIISKIFGGNKAVEHNAQEGEGDKAV